MKQKLPEEKFSYKNLYLGEIQKTKISSNSWAKRILIRLLTTKFFNKKNLVSSFNFRTIVLSINSYYSGENRNLILNSLMLFAPPFFISIYHSNTINIVEKKNFSLTKVQKQDYFRKNYMDIYEKSFRDLNKNFVDIFLHSIFEKKKLSKYKSIFEIITHHNTQIFLQEINNSVKRERSDSRSINFRKKFLEFYLFGKEMKNQDYFWVRRQILQNLQTWGESNEILVKCSLLLNQKKDLYLSNYLKSYIWQFLTNKSHYYGKRIKSDIGTAETSRYFSDELNNPNLFISLENILSYAIYRFSRHLVYAAKEPEGQAEDRNLLTNRANGIDLLDLLIIKKNLGINPQFFDSINHNQLSDLQIDFFNFQWIIKILYLKHKLVLRAVSIKQTFLNKSLFSLRKKVDSYVNPSINLSVDEYIINDFFPRRSQEKNRKFFFFSKPLLIPEVIRNLLSKEKFNRISKNFRRINQFKIYIESDDIGIISSWKIYKYYLNFPLDYFVIPKDHPYSIIRRNYYFTKQIQCEIKRKFNEICRLFSLLTRSGKIFSLIGAIELKESLEVKNKQLIVLMTRSNKIKDLNFTKETLLFFQDNNGTSNVKNDSMEYYSSIENLITDSFRRSSELGNNLSVRLFNLGGIYLSSILHKYSQLWKINYRKSFIYTIENIKYNKLGFKFSHWIYKIKKDSSRGITPSNFPIKFELIPILQEYFQNSDSNSINKISNPLQISTDICNIHIDQSRLFDQTSFKDFQFIGSKSNINNRIVDLFTNEMNDEIMINSLIEFATQKNILLKLIRNEELFVYSKYNLNLEKFLIKFQLNYRKIFSFCSEGDYDDNDNNDIKNNSVIYFQFLKNFSKYNRLNNRLNQIFIKQKFSFFEKKISQLVRSKLNNFSFFEISENNLDKTKFLFFYNLREKVAEHNTLSFSANSKINLSEQEIKAIKTLFTKSKIGIHKNLLQDLNSTGIGNRYNILRYEPLTKNLKIGGLIFQAINKILLSPGSRYSESKELKYEFGEKISIHPYEVHDKSNQIKIFNFSKKEILFEGHNYTSWFFTYEWWEYNINIFLRTLGEHSSKIGSYFEYFINSNIELLEKTLVDSCKKKINLYTLNSKWNSRLFFYHTEEVIVNFVGSDFQSINNFNNVYWAIFSLMAFSVLFYKNYFSIFLGSNSIDLWKNFENIKYLTDTSQAFYFVELWNRSKVQLDEVEISVNFFSNLKHYAKNIRFYLLTKNNLNKWLMSHKSVDRSRRKRNLLVQSLIAPTQIKEYGFQFYHQPEISNNPLFGYYRNSQHGLSYLRYLSEMLKEKLVDYPVHLADKWIFFVSVQKIISSQILQQTETFDSRFRKIPIPLQLGLSCSKGILLIGPAETGRSYLIKNLAADSLVPPSKISINKLLYNKPDVITESWMNILIQSLRRLNLTLNLARGMSPCIIWIRDIHQLDVERPTQNIESDPTFLLGILLKHFQTDLSKAQPKNNMIIVGSTHVPKKVDPSLISPDRLDRIFNIRLLDTYRRKNQFPILLKRNNIQLNKNLLYFNEFGSRTMGYNIRDLKALTNETSLINITKNESFVSHDILKLAFHRQVFGFGHTDKKPDYQHNLKIFLYKIGRAIIQNIMIEGSATNPLNISNYLWKRKFYYLSKWYSESSIDDPIIKESTVLVHILGSSAGIAARDSWFVSEKDSDISISLDKLVENDLDLAFSLLETLSNDFAWLETCNNKFLDYRREKSEKFLTKNLLNTMHNGIFAVANEGIENTQNRSQYGSLLSGNDIIDRKIGEFNNTTWSPRFWRLSFSRNHLFNWIKRPNDFEFDHSSLGFSNKNNLERKNKNYGLADEKNEPLFYERILPRVRKRNVERLESQFENILLEEHSEILGFFGSSTQYQMEYQMGNKPRLFIGKRILWDPISSSSQIRNFVFSRSEFFVDEEMLRRLYITYGVRRERERSFSSHRIKRFFICRGYNKDLINQLSVRWWNNLPIDQKKNIYTLGQIEKIGIRLKRPQVFTPVYLYQRRLIENIPGKFSRLNLLTHRARWIKINTVLLNDSLTYKMLLESYQYLFEFFLSNKRLLNKMTRILVDKKWIFQNEIKYIIRHIENTEFF